MRTFGIALVLSVFGPLAPAQEASPRLIVSPQASGVAHGLRGLCVVDALTAWTSGGGGTVLKTADGGVRWTSVGPPGSGALQFRDVHAWDAAIGVILSAGSPTRAYRTEDGGEHWGLAFEDARAEPFYDALDFWDARRGVAFGDPLNGRLLMIETNDGGTTWTELATRRRPPVGQQEGGFAASGTCLTVGEQGRVWIGLGGAPAPGEPTNARVVYSHDAGKTWRTADTPLPRSASAGVFRSRCGTLNTAYWSAAIINGLSSPSATSPSRSTAAPPGGRLRDRRPLDSARQLLSRCCRVAGSWWRLARTAWISPRTTASPGAESASKVSTRSVLLRGRAWGGPWERKDGSLGFALNRRSKPLNLTPYIPLIG